MGQDPTLEPSNRFAEAIRRFDAANSHDPNVETVEGVPQPRELVYARRLTEWVARLCPTASEPLRLAARCQHLCRWEIPRAAYPMNRAGYLRWRAELKHFHAARSGEILRGVGYDDATIARVQRLNLKQDFPADAECRVLEDALCLVFLEHQLAALAARSTDEQIINALRKSWQKMTTAARAEALKLKFGQRERQLIQQALAGSQP